MNLPPPLREGLARSSEREVAMNESIASQRSMLHMSSEANEIGHTKIIIEASQEHNYDFGEALSVSTDIQNACLGVSRPARI